MVGDGRSRHVSKNRTSPQSTKQLIIVQNKHTAPLACAAAKDLMFNLSLKWALLQRPAWPSHVVSDAWQSPFLPIVKACLKPKHWQQQWQCSTLFSMFLLQDRLCFRESEEEPIASASSSWGASYRLEEDRVTNQTRRSWYSRSLDLNLSKSELLGKSLLVRFQALAVPGTYYYAHPATNRTQAHCQYRPEDCWTSLPT